MKCKEAKTRISLLCDERLDNCDRADLNQHVDLCPSCSEHLRQCREVSTVLESLTPGVPVPEGWRRLSARIEADGNRRRTPSPAYVLAVGAAFAIVLTLFLITPRHQGGGAVAHHGNPPARLAVRAPVSSEAPKTEARVAEKPSAPAVILNPAHRPPRRHHRASPAEPMIAKTAPVRALGTPAPAVETVAASEEISAGADKLVSNGLGVLVDASVTGDDAPRGEDL